MCCFSCNMLSVLAAANKSIIFRVQNVFIDSKHNDDSSSRQTDKYTYSGSGCEAVFHFYNRVEERIGRLPFNHYHTTS